MMKKLLSLLLLVLPLLMGLNPLYAQATVSDEETFQQTNWHWQDVEHRIQWGSASLKLFGHQRYISVVRFNPWRVRTTVINDAGPKADSCSALASRHDVQVAVNGSYFDKNLCPTTFTVEDRVLKGKAKPGESVRVNGVVGIRGRRVDIVSCDMADSLALRKKYRDILAAGPVLLSGGKQVFSLGDNPPAYFYQEHPRTVVGKDADDQVYFIVIDGRHQGQARGVSLETAIWIARQFGLVDAINMDGGGSSTLWVRGAGVLNHPSDNGRFDHCGQRKIPNILSVSW